MTGIPNTLKFTLLIFCINSICCFIPLKLEKGNFYEYRARYWSKGQGIKNLEIYGRMFLSEKKTEDNQHKLYIEANDQLKFWSQGIYLEVKIKKDQFIFEGTTELSKFQENSKTFHSNNEIKQVEYELEFDQKLEEENIPFVKGGKISLEQKDKNGITIYEGELEFESTSPEMKNIVETSSPVYFAYALIVCYIFQTFVFIWIRKETHKQSRETVPLHSIILSFWIPMITLDGYSRLAMLTTAQWPFYFSFFAILLSKFTLIGKPRREKGLKRVMKKKASFTFLVVGFSMMLFLEMSYINLLPYLISTFPTMCLMVEHSLYIKNKKVALLGYLSYLPHSLLLWISWYWSSLHPLFMAKDGILTAMLFGIVTCLFLISLVFSGGPVEDHEHVMNVNGHHGVFESFAVMGDSSLQSHHRNSEERFIR